MPNEVYTGVWVNWSQGPSRGATLTVETRSGGFLTAFVAFFVTIVGTQLWRLACYFIHQARSTPSRPDRNFYEKQVILRNAATPATGAWAFMVHGYQDRKGGNRSLLRSLPWLFVSVGFILVFGVAAVFSSDISKSTGNERLVKSDICGEWPAGVGEKDWTAKMNNDTYTAASYARACYGVGANKPECSRMPVAEITYKRDRNATCPFKEGLCVYGNTAALNLDTGLIDSRDHLGINTPAEKRVQIQITKTCAPINTTNYIHKYNATAGERHGSVGDTLYEYHFGPTSSGTGQNTNVTTYVVNSHAVYGSGGYVLTSYTSIASSLAAQYWTPSLELNRTDADVSIFFLEANTIRFNGTSDDPIFSAHDPSTTPGSTVYFSDDWASVMACAEQLRVCNPLNNECTPYMGAQQLLAYFADNGRVLNFADNQLGVVVRVMQGTIGLTLGEQVGLRGANALRVIETLNGLFQPPVPNDQWMIEIGSWFDTALAKFQLAIMEWAAGPSNPDYAEYYVKPIPGDLGLLELCGDQIVHDASSTTSFSVLGLAVLFTVGGLIIILNQSAEMVIAHIQKKSGHGYGKQKRWVADDVMNLQQIARNAKTTSSSDAYSLSDYKTDPDKRRGSTRTSVMYSPAPSHEFTPTEATDFTRPGPGHKQTYLNDYGAPLPYTAFDNTDQYYDSYFERRR